MTAEELKNALETLAVEHPVVEIVGKSPHFFVTVVSGSFAGVDDAVRQEQVWSHLRKVRPDDSVEVEFIVTNAPNEAA